MESDSSSGLGNVVLAGLTLAIPLIVIVLVGVALVAR